MNPRKEKDKTKEKPHRRQPLGPYTPFSHCMHERVYIYIYIRSRHMRLVRAISSDFPGETVKEKNK